MSGGLPGATQICALAPVGRARFHRAVDLTPFHGSAELMKASISLPPDQAQRLLPRHSQSCSLRHQS